MYILLPALDMECTTGKLNFIGTKATVEEFYQCDITRKPNKQEDEEK